MRTILALFFALLFRSGAVDSPSKAEDEFMKSGVMASELSEGRQTTQHEGQCVFLPRDSPKVQRLVELTGLELKPTDVETFESRMREIAQIFSQAGDRRGLFAAIYRVVSEGGLEAVSRIAFKDNEGARRLIIEFGKTYFDSLNGYFGKGSKLKPEWKEYFSQAEDCSVHPLKVLATGMNTHITLDLVDALVRAQVRAEFREDYLALGDGLIRRVDDVINSVVHDYGVKRGEAVLFLKGIDHPWTTLSDGRNMISNFSMGWLRARAWEDAVSQCPWMRSTRAPLQTKEPEKLWNMGIRFRFRQTFFSGLVSAVSLINPSDAQPTAVRETSSEQDNTPGMDGLIVSP